MTEFKLSEWRGEVFGGGVYPESKVKEFIKRNSILINLFIDGTITEKEMWEEIDKLAGLNEGDN